MPFIKSKNQTYDTVIDYKRSLCVWPLRGNIILQSNLPAHLYVISRLGLWDMEATAIKRANEFVFLIWNLTELEYR